MMRVDLTWHGRIVQVTFSRNTAPPPGWSERFAEAVMRSDAAQESEAQLLARLLPIGMEVRCGASIKSPTGPLAIQFDPLVN